MTERVKPRRRRRGDNLLGDIAAFIRRYVVMPDDKLLVIAAWVVHTHCVREFEQTPYLAVTSPEKQCGKSRLLEVIAPLVARPWVTIAPSEAVVYRKVDMDVPTLMLDEVDTIFNQKMSERYEGLRALLNAGHRRGTTVPRCLNGGASIIEFSVFCPKVLAGIGTLPDTVADRSIPIRLERRTRDQTAERFIGRDVTPIADELRGLIEGWAATNASGLGDLRPAMPDELSDRMQEGCEPLVAIADALGDGEQVRDALVTLLTGERLDSQESMRLRLLRDLRTIYDEHPKSRAAFTSSIIKKLYAMEEAGWISYYGRGLDARDLAKLLGQYGIKPKPVRSKDEVGRGYHRDDLQPAWDKYLTDAEEEA